MTPLWLFLVFWSPEATPAALSPRAAALAAWDAGRTERALVLLDSLGAAEPPDAEAAYWAARLLEGEGRLAAARCRFLDLEARSASPRLAALAGARGRALERREADLLLERGIDAAPAREGVPALLLLPPEELHGDGQLPFFGLSWTYLVGAALQGGPHCTVSISSMLVVEDLLREGRAVRAPASVSRFPVNTVEGLRARLAALPDASGATFLEEAAGAWDEKLEQALIRFQREAALPTTGEADLPTQARLEDSIERWLAAPPAPVEPKLLPRAAELLGAAAVVRGTYRREEGEIEVSLAVLDARGASLPGEPIVSRFRPSRAAEAAEGAARRIAERLGDSLPPRVPSWSLSVEELERATASLLLIDRGLPHLAEAHWSRAPQSWLDWPLLRGARSSLALTLEDSKREEARLRREWMRPPGLDPRPALDAFARELGLPAFPPSDIPEPSPHGVLGSEGILHVHGSGE